MPAAAAPVELRPETPADAAAIDAVIAAAFLHATHTSHTEHFIVRALRRAGQLSVSLVAVGADGLLGHAALSPVSISDGTPGWFGLGPLAVQPASQRRGIGSRLLREALQSIRRQGAAGCVVLGDPYYYGRFGFRADPGLMLPGVPPEYFQAIAFLASTPRGIVSYHEAFEARDSGTN